jgi:hypothetical protein
MAAAQPAPVTLSTSLGGQNAVMLRKHVHLCVDYVTAFRPPREMNGESNGDFIVEKSIYTRQHGHHTTASTFLANYL